MALETATYISGLNSANPPAGDPGNQGDDHLRLIKSALKATFPNITGPITKTQVEINQGIPPGVICHWYGSLGSIPVGWGLCNGSSYPKADGSGSIVSPNLVDRLIMGAGSSYGQGTTGGSASVTPTATSGAVALTQAMLPNVALPVSDPGHGHSLNDPGHNHPYSGPFISVVGSGPGSPGATAGSGGSTLYTNTGYIGISINTSGTGISVTTGGSGAAHSHSVTVASFSILPPYLALYPIMKL